MIMIARMLACAVVMLSIVGTAASQPPAMTKDAPTIKRTPLQKFDVPGTHYETVIGATAIPGRSPATCFKVRWC
jgi:hypothetical protein